MINNEGFVVDKNKPHLGGNYPYCDKSSFAPKAWKYLIDKFEIKTAIDLGGGYGFCAQWMQEQGVSCVNVDGLEENVANSVVPNAILHDLTLGKLEHENVDLVVCIEVVEHIASEYVDNLMSTMALGKYVLITHARPNQHGYHHVNCQTSEYWIEQFRRYGYELLEEDSKTVRSLCVDGYGWHIRRNGMVFRKL
jgi:hypothetical protein